MADIGNLLIHQGIERFETERDPEGHPWAPLSLAYLARRKNQDAPILTQQTYLKASLTYRATSEVVEIGSGLCYAAIHQFGGKEIPARPYLGLNRESEEEIENLVMAHFGAVA